jgi:pyrroloquinoline quinone biosynthesis protein E
MLAELTHRCPLQCPYCSNPIDLDRRSVELYTETWKQVFSEAAALGVLQVHLSGGEPTARQDLLEFVRHCSDVGLYTNLITAGIGIARDRFEALAEAGLDHVQLSIQGADAATCDRVAGLNGAFERKLAVAADIRSIGLPLTLNAVVHRANIEQIPALIDLAVRLGAGRVEIAHAQYYGWALRNRTALMPTRDQVAWATQAVAEARERLKGIIVIDAVIPDYYARFPKPCMNGWARQSLNVTPAGKVLPCHAAETIPGLTFWNVRERSLAEVWYESPAFSAFRGTAWMPEPCRSCDRREIDWGGCRCQALAITGDAAATDPACQFSPFHQRLLSLADADAHAEAQYVYRRYTRSAAGPRERSERPDGAGSEPQVETASGR